MDKTYSEDAMVREILFKKLASSDRKRRVFSSCVMSKSEKFTTRTERKYVYLIRKVDRCEDISPNHVYIRNEKSAATAQQKFNCLIKGSFYAGLSDNLFLIRYAHSLRITLESLPK
jgi:hypothetical protein